MDAPLSIADLNGLTKLDSLVDPVVYFLCRGGDVVYVGQSICLLNRLRGHPCTGKFDDIFYIRCTAEELASLEAYWIAKLKPTLNNKQLPKLAKEAKKRARILAFHEARRRLQAVTGIGRNNPKPAAIQELAKELFDEIYKSECDISGASRHS